jgi:hypothetical protein
MGRYPEPPDGHVRVFGRVVTGHGVASGQARDPRFPDGTLALQWPYFEAVDGLPLDGLHRATVNVATDPWRVRVIAPRWTVRDLQWHPEVPAETFSFVPCRAIIGEGKPVDGLVYLPHPETKPDHHQPDDVVELLLPRRPEVHTGAVVRLDLPATQVRVDGPDLGTETDGPRP